MVGVLIMRVRSLLQSLNYSMEFTIQILGKFGDNIDK